MVRTRRMAAMSGDDINGEQSSNATPNDTQPTAIAEKPAKKKRSPVKPKGRKAAKQAARPAVKEEEQAEADVQAEPQLGAQAGALAETGTSNTSIAPEDEGQNVDTSDQPSANTNTATTRPSAKSSTTSERAQPKSTKSKAKPKSNFPAVVKPPEVDEPEAECDSDIPYIPKDLRKELQERLSRAGLTYPETWRPRVDSPFDAPPPPPENPPPADSILVAGLADGEVGYLRHLLRYWTSRDKGSRTVHKFFHRLDYTYKKTDCLPEALARHDRVLALTLKRLTREIPFELFFCRLDRGYEDTDIDPQQMSPSYVIEDLVDLQGRSYAKFVPVDETDWTQTTTNHRQPKLLPGYCDAALVLVPRDNVADFLWETIEANGPPTAKYSVTQTPLRTLLENYRTLCSGSAEDHVRYWPIFSNLLRRACTWDEEKGLGVMPGTFVESLLKTCIAAKDWDLFTFAAGFTGFAFRKLHYDPRPFFKWARSEITEGRATFQDIQNGILAVLFSHSLIKYRCFSITAFYETTDETVPRDWAQNAVVRIADLTDAQIIGPQDGSELVSVMKTCFGLGPDFIELATKVVKRNLTRISFLLGFANKLHESVTSTEDATRKLYLDVAEHILNGLYIHKLHSRSAESVRAREINQLRSDKVTQDLRLLKPVFEGVEKADLARFISGLIAQNADTLLMRLTMKLVGDAKRIPPRELTHLWVPFLWLLLDVLEEHQIPLSTPRYHNIFASIMEVYLFREVGKAPKQVWQPVMRRVSCDCGLCFRVNQFLSESCSFNAVRIHGSSIAFDHVRHYLTGLREAISCDFAIDAASGTITVTKRLKPSPTALKQWETKKNKMKNQIFAKFDQAKLRAILGEEYLWFTGFQLLENLLETEVHDEKELPPPPVPSAPILGQPMDHFIIGRPDLFTPSSQGNHQPFYQSTVSGYHGPQPGQAHP